jgi:hypothetical protein
LKAIIWGILGGLIFSDMACGLCCSDSETKVAIMAGWRQAIELALSEKDVSQVDCGGAVAD